VLYSILKKLTFAAHKFYIMTSFTNLGLSEPILQAILELGFETPTPIQEKAIPLLLEGDRDFVGLAQTGTGKTAAFGLPLLERVNLDIKVPQALILSPTRELGIQIAEDLKRYSKNLRAVSIVNVYGGASIEDQIRKVKRGAHIIVATPGRLLDLINRRVVDLSQLRSLVLDEADEMLNMGFKEDIDRILDASAKDRRTWLFSATMPREVRNIAKNYMDNPVEVTVAKNTANQNIAHQYYFINNRDRYNVLKRVVDIYPNIYGIVFCRTRRETQEVAENLMKEGYNADSLHGDLTQVQRDRVMRNFKVKSLQILVATDVAARGIDVDSLTHVIHYNLPDELENYTHRSGRTARAGRSGISVSLVSGREESRVRSLSKRLGVDFEKLTIPSGVNVCESQLMHLMQKVKDVKVDDELVESFLPKITEALEGLDRDALVKQFVALEFNRFWDYYKNAQDLNVNQRNAPKGRERDQERRENSKEDRLFINIGKTDGVDVPALLNLIHENCGIKGKHVGRVDLKGVFSFFEVDKEYTETIFKGLNEAEFAGRTVRVELSGEKPAGDRSRSGGGGGGGRSRGGRGGYSGGGGSSERRDGRSGGRREGSRDRNRKPSTGGSRFSKPNNRRSRED